MEQVKKLLLAAFIKNDGIERFFTYLDETFNIPKDKLFLYQIIDGTEENFIVTFKIILHNGKRIDIKKYFRNTIPIHKKGDAIYTINALNKLIEFECEGDIGNIDYQKYLINWNKYQGNLILLSNENLEFLKIKRILID